MGLNDGSNKHKTVAAEMAFVSDVKLKVNFVLMYVCMFAVATCLTSVILSLSICFLKLTN